MRKLPRRNSLTGASAKSEYRDCYRGIYEGYRDPEKPLRHSLLTGNEQDSALTPGFWVQGLGVGDQGLGFMD